MQGWGCGAPKTENFTKILPKFRHINAPQWRIPCAILPNSQRLYAVSCWVRCWNLVAFARGVSELWGFKLRGVRVTPNFRRPLVTKLCVGGKHVLEVQERYGPPLSPCQVWWGSDFVRRQGAKKFDVFFCLFVFLFVFLSVTLFERQSLWTPLRCEGVGVGKRSWYH